MQMFHVELVGGENTTRVGFWKGALVCTFENCARARLLKTVIDYSFELCGVAHLNCHDVVTNLPTSEDLNCCDVARFEKDS